MSESTLDRKTICQVIVPAFLSHIRERLLPIYHRLGIVAMSVNGRTDLSEPSTVTRFRGVRVR
jgi:hypothetical protein